MYFLDYERKKIKDYHSAQELIKKVWYCPQCDKNIPGESDELIYLAEYDFVFHIENQPQCEINQVFEVISKNKIRRYGMVPFPKIEKLEKLIKNSTINGDTNRDLILRRDGYKCQLCGWTDERVLMVHHIIPRSSPFKDKEYIRDPINLITLCANCHRAAHHIMKYGSDADRSEMNSYLIRLNGGIPSLVGDDLFLSDAERAKWNKIEVRWL